MRIAEDDALDGPGAAAAAAAAATSAAAEDMAGADVLEVPEEAAPPATAVSGAGTGGDLLGAAADMVERRWFDMK